MRSNRRAEAIAARRRRVIRVLAEGPHTTASLASAVDASRGQAYGDCRLLEGLGWVESELEKGPVKLFYCPQCHKVVTDEDYQGCVGELRPFYPLVRCWRLTTTGRSILEKATLDETTH